MLGIQNLKLRSLFSRQPNEPFSIRKWVKEYTKSSIGRSVVDSILDRKWYATAHGLRSPRQALAHFNQVGMSLAYAPCKDLAVPGHIRLTHWGVEFLVRARVNIGCIGTVATPQEQFGALDPFSIKNPQQKKIAVVTANFGGYDRLLPLDARWQAEADFFLFTDQQFEHRSLWVQTAANYDNPDPRLRARFVKTNLPIYFQSYEWVLWLDSNILLCKSPASIIGQLENKGDFISFNHLSRKSIIAEAAVCLRNQKDDAQTLISHLAKNIHREGMQSDFIFETMVMALKPKEEAVKRMCKLWWNTISKGSKRDQLSINLAIAETPKLRHDFFVGSIELNSSFARASNLK